jgi:hypothetical protein
LQLEGAKVPLCFLDQTGLSVEHAAALRDALTTLRDRLRPR